MGTWRHRRPRADEWIALDPARFRVATAVSMTVPSEIATEGDGSYSYPFHPVLAPSQAWVLLAREFGGDGYIITQGMHRCQPF